MATDTGFGKVKFFDDFLGDTINLDLYIVNTDTGGTAAAVSEAANGVVRMTTDGTDGDIQNLFGAENWKVSTQGFLIFETRVALQTSLAQGVYIGLTDDNDADEVPINDDGGTLTTTASDAVGFVYDSAGSDLWDMVSVKGDADGAQTSVNAAFAPRLDTFQTFRIVLNSDGDADFFIDGNFVGTRENAVTASVLLAPAVAQLANGTAASVDIDYLYLCAGRA